MNRKRLAGLFACAGILALTLPGAAFGGSLENLERERSLTLETLLDANLSVEDRLDRMTRAKHRLVDLERMVLRDQRLKGKNTPIVRKAFENYDLTFLVHSSVEHDLTLQDQWLEQVGITTGSLMAARVGSR